MHLVFAIHLIVFIRQEYFVSVWAPFEDSQSRNSSKTGGLIDFFKRLEHFGGQNSSMFYHPKTDKKARRGNEATLCHKLFAGGFSDYRFKGAI